MDFASLLSQENLFSGSKVDGAFECHWQSILAFRKIEHEVAATGAPFPFSDALRSDAVASAVHAALKGVQGKQSKEEVRAASATAGLAYLGDALLSRWVDDVVDHFHQKNPLIFRQYFEATSSTYTYLLADAVTKDAILIDPVLETVDRDYQQVKDMGLNLKFVMNTHMHADHITGTGKLKQKIEGCQSIIGAKSGAKADLFLQENDVVRFGTWKVHAVATPGHTEGCISYVLDDLSRVFTGDTMLIRGCGRTDFQGGSAETLYSSIHDKLYRYLPDCCKLYPAHDYKGLAESSIGEEKRLNPRLTKTKEEFVQIMNNLNLPRPKKIDEAVPANLVCGLF